MQILRDRARDPRTRIGAALGLAVVAVAAIAVTRIGSQIQIGDGHFTSVPTVLSIITGDVHVRTDPGGPSRPGEREEPLVAGTTVEAEAPNGRAVLTFRDGSTTEVEPGSSVRIEEHSIGKRGELIVRLRQDRGRTWSYVQPLLSPDSRFHLTTPSTTVVVRGTKLEVEVEENGSGTAASTTVSVFEGRADLVVRGTVVPIPAGHSAEIVDGSAPSAARALAPESFCMRFEVSSEALITVTDPAGRSAGQTTKGALSQIPRTIVTGPQTDPQAIEIFSPVAGGWEIGIVPRDDGGPLRLRVFTAVDGQLVDTRDLVTTLGLGQRVVTSVRLDPDGRGGSFAPPVQTTVTRAVGLPSDATTTAPLPRARLLPASEDPPALACIPVEVLQQPGGAKQPFDVKPVGSPEQTSGR